MFAIQQFLCTCPCTLFFREGGPCYLRIFIGFTASPLLLIFAVRISHTLPSITFEKVSRPWELMRGAQSLVFHFVVGA